MRIMTRAWLAGAALGLTVLAAAAADAPADLTRGATFAQLQDQIKDAKGKVIVLDFWAEWCVPCRNAYPHLVQLHEKLGKDGLVVIPINIDDPKDKDSQGALAKFLKMQKAPYPSLVFQDQSEIDKALKKYKIEAIPHIVVFNRAGQIAAADADAGGLEEIVRGLLKKEP